MLFVSPRYLFPTDSGGKIRTVSVLRGMKGGAFRVTLASPQPPPGRDAAETGEICERFVSWPAPRRSALFHWSRLRHLVSALPVAVATDASPEGSRAVRAEIERRPDVLVLDFPHAAMLAPPPYPVPSVLFTHNVEAEIFGRHALAAGDPLRRAVWRDQTRKMVRYEGDTLRGFSGVVAVAERDREHFARAYGVTNVSVIPTGVDFDFFGYAPPPALEDPAGGTLVFTGSMDWMANIDAIEYFMEEVWPLVLRRRPQARFDVVGRTPPPGLVERARARGFAWRFTGYVDDVRPYVHAAHVYVIPLRVGGGTRIKVYEAMAMGCPVVSTRIGVEGLPVEHGRDYLAADDAGAMADAVLGLLADAGRRQELSRRARRLIEDNMSARRAAEVFERACLQVLDN